MMELAMLACTTIDPASEEPHNLFERGFYR